LIWLIDVAALYASLDDEQTEQMRARAQTWKIANLTQHAIQTAVRVTTDTPGFSLGWPAGDDALPSPHRRGSSIG
jgi:hypothetical protein